MPEILLPSRIPDLKLHLWEITEPLHWFLKEVELSSNEDLEFESIMGKRQLEFVVQRFLLSRFLSGNRAIMRKTLNGKPYLVNRKEKISITHSKNLLLLSTANIDHGVDLEWIDDRIIRLASKFCNISEMQVPYFLDDVLWYTLIWSSKESLYKVDGLGQLEFKKQLAVHFTLESYQAGWGRGIVSRGEEHTFFRIYFHVMNGYVITWAYPADKLVDR